MFYKKIKRIPEKWLLPLKRFLSGYNDLLTSEGLSYRPLNYGIVEELIAQGVGGKHVGGGSKPIDIVVKRTGIDVKQVGIKGNETGESSLMQNFSGSGNFLDEHFHARNYKNIVDCFVGDLMQKFSDAVREYNIDRVIHLWIVYDGFKVFCIGFQLDLENLFVNVNRANENSIWIDGIISEKYGTCKIYKAKKRIEVRLKKIDMQEI